MSDLYVGLGRNKPYQGYDYVEPVAEVEDANPIADVGGLDFDFSENSSSSSSFSLGGWLQSVGNRVASKFQADDGDEGVGFVACTGKKSKPPARMDASRSPMMAHLTPRRTAPRPISLPPLPISRTKLLAILKKAWEHYKSKLISANGRPLANPDSSDIDNDGNRTEFISFSEGAAYGLQRAEAMNDRATFDKLWLWISANLQRKNIKQIFNPKTKRWQAFPAHKRDNLFAWRYASGVGGRAGGVLTTYDFDPATDADEDIAAALLLAHRRWGSNGKINYKKEALAILKDIWDKETKVIANKRVLLAGETQIYTRNPFTGAQTNGINPSYFRPSYYLALFAAEDTAHNWKSLVRPSYELIVKSADATLHDNNARPIQGRVNLVPDFIALDSNFRIVDHGWRKGDHAQRNDYYFGGDAFRTLFWMTTQSLLDPTDVTARRYLTDRTGSRADFGPYSFLKAQLAKHNTIYSGYRIDGKIHWPNVTLQTLATHMAYFWAAKDSVSAKKIFSMIMAKYDQKGFWKTPAKEYYYAQNWVWFNLFLMAKGPRGLVGKTRITPSNKTYLPGTTATPARPSAPAVVKPAAGAIKVNDIAVSNYGFNGGNLIKNIDGSYTFKATAKKDPGVGIITGNHNISGKKTLKFEIKGTKRKLGGYCRLAVQVYSNKDNPSRPSVLLDPVKVRRNFSTISVPLKGMQKVAKVQFFLITDRGSVNVNIKNLRFE